MSGWQSKKAMSGYRFSFTQPYQIQPIALSSVSKEMAVIEAVDRLIDSGLTHPAADAILRSLTNNSKE